MLCWQPLVILYFSRTGQEHEQRRQSSNVNVHSHTCPRFADFDDIQNNITQRNCCGWCTIFKWNFTNYGMISSNQISNTGQLNKLLSAIIDFFIEIVNIINKGICVHVASVYNSGLHSGSMFPDRSIPSLIWHMRALDWKHPNRGLMGCFKGLF